MDSTQTAAQAQLAEYLRLLEGPYGEPHPIYTMIPPAARAALYAGVPLEQVIGPAPAPTPTPSSAPSSASAPAGTQK